MSQYHTDGHRRRLLDRFARSGLASLHDYEIVELILTMAIPRKDTKAIAKDLIARFTTVGGVLNAGASEMRETTGVGQKTATILHLLNELIAHCLRERYEKGSAIARRRDVEEYLRFYFGMRKDEYVAVLFLDNANHVIATEEVGKGTVNQCAVYPRMIVEKAIRHGASSMILAHNHPGQSPDASEADWSITERLHKAGRLLDISLLDHIVVSGNGVLSLREQSRWPS